MATTKQKRVGTGKTNDNANALPMTAGGDKIGIDIIALQSSLLNRPARKQSTHINSRYEQHDVDTTEYNIWYGRKLGNKNWKDRDISESRCSVLKDCGKTKAAKDAYFCLHFAKGRCVNGSDCTFIHRVPTPTDDKKTDITHDIFGRERHKTDRDDMGGVGSFSRDNRTLYIGGIKAATKDIEHIVRKHFEEWGNIEYVRVITNKAIAFVRYLYRSSAEFAKEAMADQTMENGELLNVRWATEDSNPLARLADERNLHRVATEVVNKRLREMSQDDQAALKFQMTGDYPNTDGQYNANAITDGNETTAKKSGGRTIMTPEPPPPQYQYKGSTAYEQHPYAKMYNKSLENKRKEGNNTDNIAPLHSVGYYFGHVPGEMNSYNTNNTNYYQQHQQQQSYTPEQQAQYDEYLKSYYSYYGYDYTKLTDEQKLQLQQYNQSYYYQQNPETPQEQFKQIQQEQEQEKENEKDENKQDSQQGDDGDDGNDGNDDDEDEEQEQEDEEEN